MNRIQEMLLSAQVVVAETFNDPALPDSTVAQMARIHAMMTNLALVVDDWQPPLPPIQERPKATKPWAEIKRKQRAAKKAKPAAVQPRHTLAREVECSVCGALPGVECWKMTLGKNSKPTVFHTAGGTSHQARIDAWRKEDKVRKTETLILNRDPEITKVVDALYEAGMDGEIVEDPDKPWSDLTEVTGALR